MTLKTQSIKWIAGAAVVGGVFLLGSSLIAQSSAPSCGESKCESDKYDGFLEASPWGRYSIEASKNERHTSKQLDMKRVEYLCGDMDGCEIRMGLYDWDGQLRVASRSGLFYYNKESRAWRSNVPDPTYQGGPRDPAGTDFDGNVQDVFYAWSCYLTDGEYTNGSGSDSKRGFNLVNTDQKTNYPNSVYNASCWLTLID